MFAPTSAIENNSSSSLTIRRTLSSLVSCKISYRAADPLAVEASSGDVGLLQAPLRHCVGHGLSTERCDRVRMCLLLGPVGLNRCRHTRSSSIWPTALFGLPVCMRCRRMPFALLEQRLCPFAKRRSCSVVPKSPREALLLFSATNKIGPRRRSLLLPRVPHT